MCGNIYTQPVAATAFTIQDCRENLTLSSRADGFVCSFMVVSGTAARNALMDAANQSRTVLTGCRRFAEINGVTCSTLKRYALLVGRYLSFGNVKFPMLRNCGDLKE
jgi:hypothetical protein